MPASHPTAPIVPALLKVLFFLSQSSCSSYDEKDLGFRSKIWILEAIYLACKVKACI